MSGDPLTRDLEAFHAEGDDDRRTARLIRGYVNRREERSVKGGSDRYHGRAMRISARASSPWRRNPQAIEIARRWRLLDVINNTRRKAAS